MLRWSTWTGSTTVGSGIPVAGAQVARGRTSRVAGVRLDLIARLPGDWRDAIKPHLDPDSMVRLGEFLAAEYAQQTVYPPVPDLFRAFRLCPLAQTRVLILGQDPYHQPGQAHGLSFSVPPGVAPPPSLRNIFRELRDDLGVEPPANGDLSGWARQGVLLLNTVLTVRAGAPGSHAGHGWEPVTDAAIRALAGQPQPVVFALWGVPAKRKAGLVNGGPHVVLTAGHPSPANPRGFRGSRPFSAINAALVGAGREPVRWA
jgi:uracil-DNA glycosylase